VKILANFAAASSQEKKRKKEGDKRKKENSIHGKMTTANRK